MDEEQEPIVSGLTMRELGELIDSLDPNLVGKFDSFEALVRYAEAAAVRTDKLVSPGDLDATKKRTLIRTLKMEKHGEHGKIVSM